METQKGPIKTTVLLKGDYMGFHVSLGECNCLIVDVTRMLSILLLLKVPGTSTQTFKVDFQSVSVRQTL